MSKILSMSDEDFINQGPSLMDEFEEDNSDARKPEPEEADPLDEGQNEGDGAEATGEGILSGSGEEAEEKEIDEIKEEEEEALGDPEGDEEDELDELPKEEENTSKEGAEEASVPHELEKVLQPFRANGKDVQVHSVEEAITLMQLGANYTKKMQELSPNLKVLKTLEKHELLDPDKLNYLIDLSKKDPGAIAKLIKDAEYEPKGLDEEEDNVEYTPTNHQVSDNVVQLEEVLSGIENTPTYDKCIDVIGNQWDEKSKQLLTQEPQLIRSLNEQMQQGIFDKVNDAVERAKMFGGLSGLSDFEAYKVVGAEMMAKKELTVSKPKPVAKTQIKPLDKAISQKRKAATTSKSTSKTTAKEQKNYLAMSDEDFLKISNIQL